MFWNDVSPELFSHLKATKIYIFKKKKRWRETLTEMKMVHLVAASQSRSQIILLLQFLLVVFRVHTKCPKSIVWNKLWWTTDKNRERFCFMRPPLGRWMDNGGRQQQSLDSIINQQVSWKHFISRTCWAVLLHYIHSTGYFLPPTPFFFLYKINCSAEQYF